MDWNETAKIKHLISTYTTLSVKRMREGIKKTRKIRPSKRGQIWSGLCLCPGTDRGQNKTSKKKKEKQNNFNNINVVPSTNLLYIHRTP